MAEQQLRFDWTQQPHQPKRRALIACECSGRVRDAFAERGWDAWSCDLKPADTGGQHIQADVLPVLRQGWDLLIAHPPCTRLTITANKWFKPEYADRFPEIHEERAAAIAFFMAFADAPVPHICIENPVGIMSTVWRPPDQIIQPFYFGHPEPKKTCLWLKNLPMLQHQHTPHVKPDYHVSASGKRLARWYYIPSPSPERQRRRSVTFDGIAHAMSDEWGGLVPLKPGEFRLI